MLITLTSLFGTKQKKNFCFKVRLVSTKIEEYFMASIYENASKAKSYFSPNLKLNPHQDIPL